MRTSSLQSVSGPPWPGSIELVHLPGDGVRSVDVDPEVFIDAGDPVAMLEFLRFLRDAAGARLSVNWRARLGRGVPIAAITHLQPPVGGAGLALNPAVAVWREQYHPDRFVWRAGPGFVLLTDTRPGSPQRRGDVRDRAALRLFHQLQLPTPLSAGDAPAAVEKLEREGVLLRLADLALALPVHQRRPPIIYRRAMHTFQSAFDTPVL